MIGTFVGGARYLTADLELFASEEVFSRFQLEPNRTNSRDAQHTLVGEGALAGTDLQALGGWCARPYRVHDYLLGRWNMATYLRREFVLRADNPVFKNWSDNQRAESACAFSGYPMPIDKAADPGTYWLQVIPLPPDNFGSVEPEWPVAELDRDQLLTMIKARANAVLSRLRADNLPGVGPWFLSLVGLPEISKALAEDVVNGLMAALKKRGLLQDGQRR